MADSCELTETILHSERTQGFTADPDYWKGEVFVYVGRNQNLKDLNQVLDMWMLASADDLVTTPGSVFSA